MTTRSSISAPALNGFRNADEVKRLVEIGCQRGLIRRGGVPAPVEKNGADAAHLNSIRSQWMDVTPEMATRWLKNNFGNRPVKEDVIRAYARDMINKAWVATHQGLAFNDEDALIDGQHRLKAIVLSGVTVRMMVTFGLPSKIDGSEMTVMDCVDRGRTRSVADQLTIQHGFKYGSLTASICAALASLCCGERTRRLSVGQTLEVYRAFEKSVRLVIDGRSKLPGLKTAGVLAGFAFAHATLGKPLEKLFERVNTGEGLEDNPTLQLLRKFLTSDEAKLFSRSLDRGLSELTLQALWLEHENRRVAKLELAQEGADWFRLQQSERVGKIAAIFKLPMKAEPPRRVAKRGRPIQQVEVPEKLSVQQIMAAVEREMKISTLLITGRRRKQGDVLQARLEVFKRALGAGHSKETIAAVMMCGVEDVAV